MDLTFSMSDSASPLAAKLPAIVAGPAALTAGGRGMRNTVVSHLRALPPNKQGFPSTGFYRTAADSVTQPDVAGNRVTLSITQIGMRQRYFGGDINPIAGKYLTEPAIAQSYGTRAGEFEGANSSLKFAFVEDEDGFMRPALVAGQQGATLSGMKPKRRKGVRKPQLGPGDVVFWLLKHAHQEPDPGVLPTELELQQGLAGGTRSYVRARLHDPNAEVTLT